MNASNARTGRTRTLTSEAEVLPLAAELRVTTGRMWRQMRRDLTAGRREITPVRLSTLAWLDKPGPMTIGELAALELMHASTMTRVVDGLEQRGLVTRRTDERDRRAVLISLTRAGFRVLQSIREHEDKVLAAQLERLTAKEREQVRQAIPLLQRLIGES
jgi:DNA-binding MarR family transcriptional regulator